MIRLPRHAQHPLGMALELLPGRFPCFRVPYPDRLIHGASCQLFPIGAPIHSQHPAGMPFQCVFRCARVCVPDAGRVVPASRRKTARGYWGELAGEDRLAVAGDTVRKTRDGMDLEDRLGFGA